MLLLSVAAALAAAGCASLEPGASEPGAVPAAERAAQPERPRWRGKKLVVYRNAYRICHVFTLKELARWYGVRPRLRGVARVHAKEMYPRRHFEPAHRGCRDAFGDTRRASSRR